LPPRWTEATPSIHLAIRRESSAGFDQDDIGPASSDNPRNLARLPSLTGIKLGHRLGLGLLRKCRRLRLAAAFTATASARLAKTTVNQSQRLIWKAKP